MDFNKPEVLLCFSASPEEWGCKDNILPVCTEMLYRVFQNVAEGKSRKNVIIEMYVPSVI